MQLSCESSEVKIKLGAKCLNPQENVTEKQQNQVQGFPYYYFLSV